MRLTLAGMRSIVATSPAYARTSDVLSSPDVLNRLKIIPLGIADQSHQLPGDMSIFDRLRINPALPYFLFVGGYRNYKGLTTLLDAASDIDAPVVLAGPGVAENLGPVVSRRNLKNVIFAGYVTDPERTALLGHCRAFVLPSNARSEAFGMVLVEAAMMSKPMITCEIGSGTTFVNSENETGLVVPPDNSKALGDAAKRLLFDPMLAETFGKAARLRYEQLFSGDALGCAYQNLYQNAVSRTA